MSHEEMTRQIKIKHHIDTNITRVHYFRHIGVIDNLLLSDLSPGKWIRSGWNSAAGCRITHRLRWTGRDRNWKK